MIAQQVPYDTIPSSRVPQPWLATLPNGLQAPAEHIQGNASHEIKQLVANLHQDLMAEGSGFGEEVGKNIRIRRVDLHDATPALSQYESRKIRSTVISEIVVDKRMMHKKGSLHGACASYLIATCTSFPMVALHRAQGSTSDFGVSQMMDTMFHAPTEAGSVLRITTTSLAAGKRTLSAKLEAWDVTNDRLVFSGTHLKLLEPPAPRARAKL